MIVKKKKRKRVDWEKGDKLIVNGNLSMREIAKALDCDEGAVRKRKKKKNLVRDITGDVKLSAQSKLVRSSVRTEDLNEEEVIEEAANIQVGVIVSHRALIKRRRDLVDKLAAELEQLTDGQDQILDIIKGLKNKDDSIVRAALRKVSSMPARIKGVTDLVKADDLLIKMERNAFNISEGEGGDDGAPKSGTWIFEGVAPRKAG